MVDPGIGFGKRQEDNLKLIEGLYRFKVLGVPVFLGLSRKSFVGGILNVPAGERLYGTLAALRQGGCVGVWHSLEQYEQQVWMGKAVLFAVYPDDFEVLHEGPKPETFVGSEQSEVTKLAGEYFYLWDNHMYTYSKFDEIPTGTVIRTCQLTDNAVAWMEGAVE